MGTSQTSALFKPRMGEHVPPATFEYFRARHRLRLYEFVITEFEKSGLTQAELARRLGRGIDQVCRWLAEPANLQADTVSDLIFAITGGEPACGPVYYPLDASQCDYDSEALLDPESPPEEEDIQDSAGRLTHYHSLL